MPDSSRLYQTGRISSLFGLAISRLDVLLDCWSPWLEAFQQAQPQILTPNFFLMKAHVLAILGGLSPRGRPPEWLPLGRVLTDEDPGQARPLLLDQSLVYGIPSGP